MGRSTTRHAGRGRSVLSLVTDVNYINIYKYTRCTIDVVLGYQVYRLYIRLYKLVRWWRWRQCARVHLHQVAVENNRLSSSRASSATVSSRVAFAPFATRRFLCVCFFVVIFASWLQCQYAIVYVCARVSVNTNIILDVVFVYMRVCLCLCVIIDFSYTSFFLIHTPLSS